MSVKLNPYLVMNGNADEAISFYEKALEGQVLGKFRFGDMPANPDYPLPAEAKNLIMHATIKIGDSELMFSDTFPGQSSSSGDQVTICVTSSDASKSKAFFEKLEQGGQVQMPLQETDFSPLYGIVKDKYGVTFQIYTEMKR